VHKSKKDMSHECLSVVRKRILFFGAKKTGDPTPALQNHTKSVRQLKPSLIKSSECKGVFSELLDQTTHGQWYHLCVVEFV
jgi:hypothetical protein